MILPVTGGLYGREIDINSCSSILGCSGVTFVQWEKVQHAVLLYVSGFFPKLQMHLLMMPPQVIVARKALPTLVAFKHLLSQVNHLVCFEALQTTEAFTTLRAVEGLHSCVLPLVSLQVSRLAKALPTVGAQVGLLSCVGPEVHTELASVREAFAAVGTRVRLLPCVDALMEIQAILVCEAFPTVGAQVQNVHLLQARVRLETFDAYITLPTLRTHVLMFLFLFLLLIWEAVCTREGQILLRMVLLDVFDEVAFHCEGEQTK